MLSPLFENIPLELKRYDQWLVWKGKKVPYDPTRPNSKADVADNSTWGTFDQAEAAYSEGGWDGVGCFRFQRHFVKVLNETGGCLWIREGNSAGNSSSRR
jgi:primase-polymerase (primpol)-like protein